jgi:tyrosyl-tRNA synthetase
MWIFLEEKATRQLRFPSTATGETLYCLGWRVKLEMAGGAKTRVDLLLVERGLVPSRTRAQALILEGRVLVSEQKVEKPGTAVPVDAPFACWARSSPT